MVAVAVRVWVRVIPKGSSKDAAARAALEEMNVHVCFDGSSTIWHAALPDYYVNEHSLISAGI